MKFKEGDRVAVYGGAEKCLDRDRHYYLRGRRGTVDSIVDNDEIDVALDNGRYVTVHPKQCRRLKKKAKPGPQRIWVNIFSGDPENPHVAFDHENPARNYAGGYPNVVEKAVPFVREKRKK